MKNRLTQIKYTRPSVFDPNNVDADVVNRITVKTRGRDKTIARLFQNGARRVWISDNIGGVPEWKEVA